MLQLVLDTLGGAIRDVMRDYEITDILSQPSYHHTEITEAIQRITVDICFTAFNAEPEIIFNLLREAYCRNNNIIDYIKCVWRIYNMDIPESEDFKTHLNELQKLITHIIN